VQRAAVLEGRLAEFLTVVEIVGIIGEACLAVITALDDVLGNTGKIETGQSGHPWLRSWRRPQCRACKAARSSAGRRAGM